MKSRYSDRFLNKTVAMAIAWPVLLVFALFVNAPPAHAEDPFFSIALSKFKNEQDAAKEESKLKNSGHNAFFREEKSPNNKNIFYQVYIEKYNSRDEAEKEARVLKELELISDYTVREVKEVPLTPKEEKIPAEENIPETLPAESTEIKESSPDPGQVIEEQTAAAVPSPIPEDQSTAPDPGTDAEKFIATPESFPETERLEPVQTPAVNNTKQESEPNTEQKSKPVQNHDDERLTGASLQVGAFSDEANAAALKIKLRNMGKNAFYRYESADSKGDFYRLYITGYPSLREAINDAKELKRSGIISNYSRVHSNFSDSNDLLDESSERKKEEKIYFIHVSSNKDEANAVENVARLKKSGYKAFYVLEKDLSSSWYRVYIGEFNNEAEARKKGMELLDQGLISYFKPIAVDRKTLDN